MMIIIITLCFVVTPLTFLVLKDREESHTILFVLLILATHSILLEWSKTSPLLLKIKNTNPILLLVSNYGSLILLVLFLLGLIGLFVAWLSAQLTLLTKYDVIVGFYIIIFVLIFTSHLIVWYPMYTLACESLTEIVKLGLYALHDWQIITRNNNEESNYQTFRCAVEIVTSVILLFILVTVLLLCELILLVLNMPRYKALLDFYTEKVKIFLKKLREVFKKKT